MNPITHLLVGWTVAETTPGLDRRSRALVAWASVIPDLDGLGMPVEILTRDSRTPLLWFTEYHHILCHNIGFALLVTGAAAFFAKSRRVLTAALVALSFHLHLLGDLVGARGPDGEQWPIPYLRPFSAAWELTWAHQWPLNGWQNISFTILLLALAFRLAWRRGYSPVELFSPPAERGFMAALHRRFPKRAG